MTLNDPPMLPEDRKHLDVPPMPVQGMCFRRGGQLWQLVSVNMEVCPVRRATLSLEFIAVDSVNPGIPV